MQLLGSASNPTVASEPWEPARHCLFLNALGPRSAGGPPPCFQALPEPQSLLFIAGTVGASCSYNLCWSPSSFCPSNTSLISSQGLMILAKITRVLSRFLTGPPNYKSDSRKESMNTEQFSQCSSLFHTFLPGINILHMDS